MTLAEEFILTVFRIPIGIRYGYVLTCPWRSYDLEFRICDRCPIKICDKRAKDKIELYVRNIYNYNLIYLEFIKNNDELNLENYNKFREFDRDCPKYYMTDDDIIAWMDFVNHVIMSHI